jgi:hypothetical protein
LLGLLLFDPEYEGMLFRNVGWLSPGYTALYPKWYNSSYSKSVHVQRSYYM